MKNEAHLAEERQIQVVNGAQAFPLHFHCYFQAALLAAAAAGARRGRRGRRRAHGVGAQHCAVDLPQTGGRQGGRVKLQKQLGCVGRRNGDERGKGVKKEWR